MKTKADDKAPRGPDAPPATRRRFRVEKLEERIAPARGGKATRNCSGSIDSGASTTTNASASTIF